MSDVLEVHASRGSPPSRQRRAVGLTVAAALAGGTIALSGAGAGPAEASAVGCSVVGGQYAVVEWLCQDTKGSGLLVDSSQAAFQKAGFFICNLRARFRVLTYDGSSYTHMYTSTQTSCQLTVASRTLYMNIYLKDGSTICASVTNNYHSAWSGTQCHNIHK